MTPPPRDSLEERAENKTKDFEYTVICPESEKTAFRDGYIWGARLELQALRDEIKDKEKYHNDNFSQHGKFFMMPSDIYDLIEKRMK